MKKLVITVVLALLVILGIGLIGGGSDVSNSAADAPDVEIENNLFGLLFQDFEGNDMSFANDPGKPLVLNSWAVWCPFCKDELTDFAFLQEEFGDDILVVAINRGESIDKQRAFTDAEGLTERLQFLIDDGDTFYKAIGGIGMPETLFIDSEGNTVHHKRGPMELAEMRSKVLDILGE